jgi:hypothetical protein
MMLYEKEAESMNRLINIFSDREDYRIHFDGARYIVFDPIKVVGNFQTKEAAESIIERRSNPREIPDVVYSDICRCGALKENWDYYYTASNPEYIFERCNLCKKPLRHNAMVELNRKQIEDFDLDAFIQGL